MRVLVLGGTGFLGRPITQRLVAAGADVSVFHRGTTHDVELGRAVRVLHGDRNTLGQYIEAFRDLRPEVVVDLIAFTHHQAEALMNVFRGVARRVVVLSSGDVYRAN